MKARGGLAILVCALAATALPADASADRGHFVFPGSFSLHARLGKSNGYTISVDSLGRRQVALTVRHGGQRATYRVRGHADEERLSANFGRFGLLRGDFAGETSERSFFIRGCRGRKTIIGTGRLTGSFHFRGEDGYVEIAVKGAKARYAKIFRHVCDTEDAEGLRRPSPSGAEEFTAHELEARSRHDGGRLSFRALETETGFSLLAAASISERAGRVGVERVTEAGGELAGLDFGRGDPYPRTATVTPHDPFRGSATYTEQQDGSIGWAGDLRVPLAGLGVVPLAGPGFRAERCSGDLLDLLEGCP